MKLIRWTLFLIMLSVTALGQNGPGGIGSGANLAFWLDANNGVVNNPVTTWSDISGNNVSTTIHGTPTPITNALNGMNVVRFHGAGSADEVYTPMYINADTWPQLSVIAVYSPRVQYAGAVWGEDNGVSWDRFLADIDWPGITLLNSCVGIGYGSNESSQIPNLFNLTPVLSTVTYFENLYQATHAYINGNNVLSVTSNANAAMENGTSTFYVGAIGSNGFRFDGDIAEVIVFRSYLTDTHRIIAENYLSAKYGLTLSANNLYNEDDLGYDFDVAGLGNLNASIQNNSRGSGIVRMWNASNLDNGEFLFWGHDNGTLQAVNTTDVPTGVQARSARVWKVSEVNTSGTSVDVGSVNLSFNLANLGAITASDLRLLVDYNNNGNFADETSISGAVSLGSNEYAFMGVTAIADNLRFTIGTINTIQTPLPVTLKYFRATVEKKSTELTWQSIAERNILEYNVSRSADGVTWTPVGSCVARGPSTYSLTDANAGAETRYYKLTEVDFDSEESYCGIVSVKNLNRTSFVPFPNPAKEVLTVPVNSSKFQYHIFNSVGVDCTKQTLVRQQSETEAIIDVGDLPPGQFLLRLAHEEGFHFLKENR